MSFFPFRKKGRKAAADSNDFVEEQQGQSQRSPPSRHGGASQSQRFGQESVRRSGTPNSGGQQSPSYGEKRSSFRSNNGRAEQQFGGSGSSRGFHQQSPTQQQHFSQQRSPHSGQGSPGSFGQNRPSSPFLDPFAKARDDAEAEAGNADTGIPADWAAKPSRGRRFTATARPDLHKSIEAEDEFGDLSDDDEDGDFDLLEKALEKMEKSIQDTQERAEEEEEEEMEEFEVDIDAIGGRKSVRHSVRDDGFSRRSKLSGKSGGSKRSRKKFEIPEDLCFEGFLFKRGTSYRRNWTRRKFIVRCKGVRLDYYSEKSDVRKGYIDLTNATIEKQTVFRRHRNSNINPEFEFVIQERNERNKRFELAAPSEAEFDLWFSVIERILQLQEEHKRHFPRRKGAKVDEPYDEVEETEKWDQAQNWVAFGPGLYESRIGQECTLTIQARDGFGNPLDHPGMLRPSVVLETKDLHYDVAVEDNDDGTFTAKYCPTKMADYELTIMVDGFDIYGSPFHPKVLPAPVCTRHCVADGIGLLCSILDHHNEFTIFARNEFDEVIDVSEELEFEVSLDAPLKLESITNNGDGSYRVKYIVECTSEELRQMQADDACLSGSISVTLDDGRSAISRRHIKGSPFSPGIAASLSPEDLAAAYTASEFSKLIQENNAKGSTNFDLKNPFITFSKMLRNSGLLNVAPSTVNVASRSDSKELLEFAQSPASDMSAPNSPDGFNTKSTNNDGPAEEYTPSPFSPNEQPNVYPLHHQQEQSHSQNPRQQQQNITPQSAPAPFEHAPTFTSSYFPVYTSGNTTSSWEGNTRQSRQPASFGVNGQGVGPDTIRTNPSFQTNAGGWVPQGEEADMVHESLEERAKEIEREKQELHKKRRELDESRLLIDEQVRKMAEIGRQVHADSERVIEEARRMADTTSSVSPLTYAVKENLVSNPLARRDLAGQEAQSERAPLPKKVPGPTGLQAKQSNPSSRMLIFDKALIALLDKHALVLSRVYEYYKSQNGTNAIQISDVIKLSQDYDITPTFISRKEIREIYQDVQSRFQEGMYSLSYESFLEVLANIAVHSLSKPMFAHLYSTNLSKVNVLLTMWGLADAIKLSEIQEEKSMM